MAGRGGKREKCYLCDLPKAAWTILNDFSEPVCRGCVNYEGIDRVEDAIHDSRRLRQVEGHGSMPSGDRQGCTVGSSVSRQNGSADPNDLLCGTSIQSAGATSATLPITAIVGSGSAGGSARAHASDPAIFDDFPSPMTPYSTDMTNRGYGGAIRMVDMNGGYSGYSHVGGMEYMRAGLYPTESTMAANFYGGWRAMKRAVPVDDSWYYPSARQSTSSKRTSQASPDGPSSTGSAPPAKKSKPPPDSPGAQTGGGTLRNRSSESGGSTSSQNGTVAASPDSRMTIASSESDKLATRVGEAPSVDNIPAVQRETSGVSTSTSQAEQPAPTSSAPLTSAGSAATAPSEEHMSATPRPADKDSALPAPATPTVEKTSEAEASSTQEKSCEHCGCPLNSVQYVQCPSVEKHRYCLFCTYMHIEWCDAGTVSCPSKQRCPHPNSDIPWVFLPNEIDSIRKSVQLTETPAIIG